MTNCNATDDFSTRAKAVTLRTYNRPLDEAGDTFETWDATIERSTYRHHKHLWEEAGGNVNEGELQELKQLGLSRKGLVAGRTLWLGGTPYAYSRACSQFNCAESKAQTVYDIVDISWLLLNGCGVGFRPQVGTLHGYTRPVPQLEIVPSTKDKNHRGPDDNRETLPTSKNNFTWTITVGDSAQAWAKAAGKLLNPQARHAQKLVLDFSKVRGSGGRLKGYGWIANGYRPFAACLQAYHEILNAKAGNLLDEIDIVDVVNHLGQVLSSRRAAELAALPLHNPRAAEFSTMKVDYWKTGQTHRRQSNNSLTAWAKPTLPQVQSILEAAYENGDPTIVNASAAQNKAIYFEGFNPCGETLMGRFCNLVSISLRRFPRQFAALERAVYVMARANYRQTCVDFNDGVLQPTWHQTNQAQRLCGVSLTGIAQAPWLSDYEIRRLRNSAIHGSYSMADELGLPRPKAVTLITPSGTRAKIDGDHRGETTEGIHKPLGRYIFNWVNFSVHDPLVALLSDAGYRTLVNPVDTNNVLVCFPVEYAGVQFEKVDGKEVNLEPALAQLQRYLRWTNLWCDHNASATISMNKEEIPDVAQWIHNNWDAGYIAATFLRRNDPTRTAEDMGHPYLPQEVVSSDDYNEYKEMLRPVAWSKAHGIYEIDVEDCASGACPVR